MPYKDKKEQEEYLRRYGTPYKRQYRKFKTDQQKKLREVINRGDLNVVKQIMMVKQIMNKKPNITLFSKAWQDMVEPKRRKRK
jgi:Mg/Co/Ni transporter MgtE